MFAKMVGHTETKQMVMVPINDFQYKREGSDEWFSTPVEKMDEARIKSRNETE